jgi:DNA-binding PadR family transcriptional regulator
MSLSHALLGLLAERPMSGFDLIREFDVSRSVVWPAPQNEVYRILARLAGEGLIAEQAAGPRGRRSYAITDGGRQALAQWIAAPTDYTLRYDPVLKAAFLAAATPEIRRARAEADLTFFEDQVRILTALEEARSGRNGPDPRGDVRRMALGFYAALADWSRGVLGEVQT